MDVVEERLEREYNLSLIATSPSVIYHVYKTDGTMEELITHRLYQNLKKWIILRNHM